MPSAPAAVPKPCGSVRALSGGSTTEAENTYPPPRDRHLSRKTRAAVGKPPGRRMRCPLSALLTTPSISPVQFPNG